MALSLSKYFLSMSKYCLTHYHSLVKHHRRTREHRNKIPTDPNLPPNLNPKQPLTAYILYFRERVNEFKEKHPSCTYPELTCLISKEWKELPQSLKEPYVERANEDRKRYKSERRERKARKGKQMEEESPEEES